MDLCEVLRVGKSSNLLIDTTKLEYLVGCKNIDLVLVVSPLLIRKKVFFRYSMYTIYVFQEQNDKSVAEES